MFLTFVSSRKSAKYMWKIQSGRVGTYVVTGLLDSIVTDFVGEKPRKVEGQRKQSKKQHILHPPDISISCIPYSHSILLWAVDDAIPFIREANGDQNICGVCNITKWDAKPSDKPYKSRDPQVKIEYAES